MHRHVKQVFTYSAAFVAGLVLACAFAPFHYSGLAVLSLAFFYHRVCKASLKSAAFLGIYFGLGFFGLGVSWILISIHQYGQINLFLSALITFLFILYLSLYSSLVALLFALLAKKQRPIQKAILFACLWTLSEWARAHFLSGFPWLNLASSAVDSPLKSFLPLCGSYGVTFIIVFLAALLRTALCAYGLQRATLLCSIVATYLLGLCLENHAWTKISDKALSVSIIQSNISMRDKWDEQLFWSSLFHYDKAIDKTLGSDVIVLPESAIALPENYIEDFLQQINTKAKRAHSAIILGILRPADTEDTLFYNAIIALGQGEGAYAKQHLVPFGEFIPKILQSLANKMQVPNPGLTFGAKDQPLMRIQGAPVATLICYELSYPELLRRQLPEAEWIVSLSDNGWFGHSFASFQHLQLAQMLALESGRFHIVANNNGLSSIINPQGQIIAGLKAFSTGILQSSIYRAQGATIWIKYGDTPILYLCCFLLMCTAFRLPKEKSLLLRRARGAMLSTSEKS